MPELLVYDMKWCNHTGYVHIQPYDLRCAGCGFRDWPPRTWSFAGLGTAILLTND